jgi:hypothetical protein
VLWKDCKDVDARDKPGPDGILCAELQGAIDLSAAVLAEGGGLLNLHTSSNV